MLKMKRWLCILLAGLFVVGTPAEVLAKENSQNIKLLTDDSFDLLKEESLPEVTEEQVAEFEAYYESSGARLFDALDGSQTAANAKKRASVMTSLYGITSVQYAVIQNGEIVLSDQNGYKNRSTQDSPNKNTMYNIASISKVFTTIAVLQLVEDGILGLDTPVVNYIPEFKMADSRYKDITVRMLLNHSSGLMGSTLNSCLLLNDNTSIYHDSFLKVLKKQNLKADPGAFSVYCNDGFTLAEILVENVTGKTFSAYIAENITAPLGMTNTKTPADSFNTSQMAKAYVDAATKKALPSETFNAFGAGGIISTAEDLCRMAVLFMEGNSEVLKPETAKLTGEEEFKRGMWSSETSGILDYGLGWDSMNAYPFSQYGIKALTKGGDSLYYHSEMIVLPEKNIAVAVTSVGGSSSLNLIFGQSILLDLLEEKGIIDSIIPAPEKVIPVKAKMPEELKKYEGYYANMSGIFKVQFKDDTLIYSNAYDPKNTVSYIYTEDGTFRNLTGEEALYFVTEKNGESYLMSRSYATLAGIGDTYVNQYAGQKVENNPLSSSVKKAWTEREGKAYFVINERYTSVLYLNILAAMIGMPEGIEGYMGSAKITDKNTAEPCLQIPMSGSRDLMTYTFYKKNDIEYLNMNGMVAIEEKGVKNLSSKGSFTVTIGKEAGYAKWYKVGKDSANKTIKVTLPKAGMFAVYDKDGNLVNNSYTTGKASVKLPKGGYIVFAGNKSQKFTVKYM